jgi:hypothetical protein
MHWIGIAVIGIFMIALLWGLVLTLKSPLDRPRHHDNRPGSYYYESNKKEKYYD